MLPDVPDILGKGADSASVEDVVLSFIGVCFVEKRLIGRAPSAPQKAFPQSQKDLFSRKQKEIRDQFRNSENLQRAMNIFDNVEAWSRVLKKSQEIIKPVWKIVKAVLCLGET